MAWTATIKSVDRQPDGRVQIFVAFDDGNGRTVPQYIVGDVGASSAWFQRQLTAAVSRFDDAEKLRLLVSVGESFTVAAPEVTPPPSDEQMARTAFLADWRLYGGLQRAVAAGILAADDKVIAETKVRLLAAWLPDYAVVL